MLAAIATAALWCATAHADAVEHPAPQAHAEGAFDGDDPRVETTLLVDADAVPAGERVRVGVRFDMDEHWHVYWRNPGQAAYSTDLAWDVPGEVGPTQWPMPQTFTSGDGFITTYGYSDTVLLWSWWDVPDDLSGAVEVSVTADYLACRVDCIPGRATLRQRVPVAADRDATTADGAPSERTALFDRWAARVPVDPSTLGWRADTAVDTTAVPPSTEFAAALAVVACDGPEADCPRLDAASAHFVPDRTPQVTLQVEPPTPHPAAFDGVVVPLAGRSNPDTPRGDATIGGVLEVLDAGGTTYFVELSAPLPRAPAGAAAEAVASPLFATVAEGSGTQTLETANGEVPLRAQSPAVPWWQAVLLALAGGALLNLMPCVLPVLALKVAGFATTAREGRRERARHAAAWTAGVVATMLGLGALVVGLRAAGASVGWGFQFQQPAFVIGVACVVVLFATSLFGAWHVTLSAARLDQVARSAHGPSRSALEGVLAVVLATPCSAPLLGTAVGFALAAPAPVVLGVFGAIGVGLAAPFALVSLVPGAERLVPAPGAWMERLRTLLGFALLGTACWLLWLFGRVTSADAMAMATAWLLLAALASWAFGLAQRRSTPFAIGAAVASLVVLAATGRHLVHEAVSSAAEAGTEVDADARWQPWTDEAVAAALAEGRPVFVDFTADWCITCKVNERAVLSDPRFLSVAAELDAALLLADWTRRDDRIRAELARHGKGGVPMYLVYSPSSPAAPTVLPELLAVDIAAGALRDAAASPRTTESP